jgi:hypothetical protein
MATSHRKATGEGVTGFMKYPSRKVFFRFVQFAFLAASVFSVRALAQAEISPDHFDSMPSAATSKAAGSAASVKKSTTTRLSANQAPQAALQGAIVDGNGNASATDKSPRGQQNSTSAKAAHAQPAAKSKKGSSAERVAAVRPQ